MNENSIFAMQPSCYSMQSEPCTLETFNKAIRDPHVSDLCRQIRLCNPQDNEKISGIKKHLPVFCFLASFNGKARKTENAIPSGLAYLDIDDLANPIDAWSMIEGKAVQYGCVLAHVSASFMGLRIVFQRPEGKTVEESIQWYAEQIDVKSILNDGAHLDTCVKDLARCSFVVPENYILYRDDEHLFSREQPYAEPVDEIIEVEAEEVPANEIATMEQIQEQQIVQPETVNGYPATYRGIPYADILRELIINEGFTLVEGAPNKGERHNALKSAYPKLRHICDFDANFMIAVTPDWGLPAHEVRALAEDAAKYKGGRMTMLPKALKVVLSRLEYERKQQEKQVEEVEEEDSLPMPAKLPKNIHKILKAFPAEYRPAALISALPILGALATRVRAKYYDDKMHSLSFFSCIVSPQAGGKGNIKSLCDRLAKPMKLYDQIEMEKQRKYEEALAIAKNSKEQPEDPHACIRMIPEKVSNTAMSKLLDNARGQHLMMISPEIDSVAKNQVAAWSSPDDIFRKAFDNDEIGQFYLSKDSHKSHAEAFINVMMTGTPMSMRRYFTNVEGGLVSRVSFAQLPSSYGKNIQPMGRYSDKDAEDIQKLMHFLMLEGHSDEYAKACGGVFKPRMKAALDEMGMPIEVVDDEKVPTVEYNLPRLTQAIRKWQDERTMECLKEFNPALDTFRRRAGVIGFRAGVLFYCMEGHKLTNEVIALAIWIANYVLDQQMRLFGTEINEINEKNQQLAITADAHVNRYKQLLFDVLPDKFSDDELRDICQRRGESIIPSTLRCYTSRWRKSKMIERNEDGIWVKTNSITAA